MRRFARTCLVVSLVAASIALPHRGFAGTALLTYTSQTIHVQGQSYRASVPTGYQLEMLTDALDGPRLLTFGHDQELLIGSKSGKLFRIKPPYRKPEVLVDLGGYPHSVALRGNELWIAETGGLYRATYRKGQATLLASEIKLVTSLPDTGGHSSRTVAVGPDKRIYVGLGISGNCSNEYLGDSYPFGIRRGGVWVLDETGGYRLKTHASGLRNPVGFDWHPVTHEMYASNNGPDHQGFEQPPEYFSRLLAGSFHGMPWFQYDGKRIRRDNCISETPPRPITDVQAPVATFPARNAPMGVVFVRQGAMDKTMWHDAVVALRGSWGTNPSGGFFGSKASRRHPKLVLVRFQQGKAVRVDDLVTGFQLPNGDRWARPVGVAIGPDGALYFTSDSANALFRLRKTMKAKH